MRRIRLIPGTLLVTVVSAVLTVSPAPAAVPTGATLVVDRDRAQCASAGFTSIQAAVDAAQPGDLLRVCPDLYSESVVIDKPLTIKGDPEAIEAVDCFQSTAAQLGDRDPTQQAIVDPAGDGFTIALSLRADDVVVEGLVVEGASVGIDADDRFSGYRTDHNLLQLNTLFGIDLGSEGTKESRVDHNCLRENQFGLVSELDDDSLWKLSDGPERDEWNARDLRNARVDHNDSFRNQAGCCGYGLVASGPGQRELVTFDHNSSREDVVGIALQNATQSAIIGNEFTSARSRSILIGGANDALEIRSNVARGGGTGMRFARGANQGFIDLFALPNTHVLVSENDVSGASAGIDANANSLVDSLIIENTLSDNRGNGIILLSGNTGNVIRANVANNNGLAGISAFEGATGNRFEYNSMHGNGFIPGPRPGADARDLTLLNDALQNEWTGNDCDTDIPAGMICGVG